MNNQNREIQMFWIEATGKADIWINKYPSIAQSFQKKELVFWAIEYLYGIEYTEHKQDAVKPGMKIVKGIFESGD